jgi:purine-binding chemotaxis protein CheW
MQQPEPMSTAEPESQVAAPPADQPQLRDLFSFSAGDTTFAVFAEDVEATAEGSRPAKLPNAPPAVLGIVSVRGRMVTTLDPLALTNGAGAEWPAELPCVVALRGDEQLALAADFLSETITIASTDIEPNVETGDSNQAILGIARHGGQKIIVLNTANLFFAAVRRRERRRRRF